MKPVGCCSGEPLSQAYGLPAQHKARPSGALKGSLIHKLANAVSNKVDRLHQKAPEYQHYRYRKRQQPALASPRRTARETSEFRRTVSTWLPQKVHSTEKFPARSPHAPHFHPLTAAKRQKSTAPSCTSCCSVLYY